MKTLLYRDNATGKLLTLEDARTLHAERNNSDLPIPDSDMHHILLTDYCITGGTHSVVSSEKDMVLDWCNSYADYQDADRFLSQAERDVSVREIYEAIKNNDSILLPAVISELKYDEEGLMLKKRLFAFLFKDLTHKN